MSFESINAATLISEFDKRIQDLSDCDVVVYVYTFDLTRSADGLGVGLRANLGEFIGIRIFQIALNSPCTGKLQVNDQVVMVNDKSLIDADISDDAGLNIIRRELERNPNRVTIGVARMLSSDKDLFHHIMHRGTQPVTEVLLQRSQVGGGTTQPVYQGVAARFDYEQTMRRSRRPPARQDTSDV
eukprot:m.131928 g.131928  ORF g.131928 m.131928 type:complete len:185 (-) comp52371_c0_seq2:101-655(-)